MSKRTRVHRSRVRTIEVPWRKICAGLPAVALIGGGIALTAVAGPDSKAVDSPAIVVPYVALAPPATRTSVSAGPFAVAHPEAPGLELPAGTMPGSSTPISLDSKGIPLLVLKAYRNAASLIGAADPGCHIDWALLAAIGRVESDHARFAGNRLDSAGVAKPGIIGISLNGSHGTARITDSDGGRLDRDRVYDRAVGPMQFIPSTWRVAGTDADGDSVKNPQDIADAATASALYLCSGPGDLRVPADLRAALLRYNASDTYARTVTAIADAYRHGVTALPASDLPSAGSPRSTSVAAPRRATPSKTAPNRSGPVPANAPRQGPTVTTSAPAPTSPGSTPATPLHAAPVPPTPDPATPERTTPEPTSCTPTVPDSTSADPAVPDSTSADSTVPDSTVSDPASADPADPVPTPLIPCVPTTSPSPASSLVSAGPPQESCQMLPSVTPSGSC